VGLVDLELLEEEDGLILGGAALHHAEQHLELLQELVKGDTNGVTSLANANGLQHTRVPELGNDELLLEGEGRLGGVGLDATHVLRVGCAESGH